MVNLTTLEARWAAALAAPAQPADWITLLRPNFPDGLSATALVVALGRSRLKGDGASPRARGVSVEGPVTMLQFPRPYWVDDLPESVSACNDIARVAGWPERMAWGRINRRARTLSAFRKRVLDPLAGLAGSPLSAPRSDQRHPGVQEWQDRFRTIRIEAIALSHFERAGEDLQEWIAEWISEESPAPPYLILDHAARGRSILVTNCPAPNPE